MASFGSGIEEASEFPLNEGLLWCDGRQLFTFKRLFAALATFGFLQIGTFTFQMLPQLLVVLVVLVLVDFDRA